MEDEHQSISNANSLLLEDFGQKVDLTRRIREVLLNYPEGTTVLKELIQNADDAGATKVRLCLDRRTHAEDSLLSPKLAQWQGPALLAYNNAVFTEGDFKSISRVGGSGKQSEAWKTGRFGVGFNSVYHLTDLPSFVSDKYVVLFDPQGDYLPNVSTSNPGKRIEYVSSSAITKYRDQLTPYIAFGCNMETSFSGTMFRFPLRNKEQASTSKLSKQAYLPDDISSMFNNLFEEGVFTLLFLKSVVSIEMYVWDTDMAEPRKTYSCSISLADKDTVWHRQALLRLSKNMSFSDNKTDGFLLDFLSEDANGDQSQKRVDTFYIVQTMAAASSRIGSFAASMSKDYDIHLLPWAAVAACISDNSSRDDVLKDGRAFCFLPLPVKTGMTVQINGYFEVSSNRRGIWYGADMDRSGRIRSLWNRLLLEDVVASSFVNLLLQVQPILGPTNSYYSLWPTGSFEEPWNILVEQIYKNIGDSPVLHSDLDGGKWVPLVDAFLHDNEFSKSKDLGTALVQLGLPIVHLPIPLRDMLLKFASSVRLKVVTPDSVRNLLRKSKAVNSLSRSLKLVLLEYCLEDLTDDNVIRNAYDLPLIPLANGEFGSFFDASKGVSYFICSELEYMLLQKVLDRVIDQNTPHNLLSRLESIAKIPSTNIFVFDPGFFLQLFTKVVPADWKYKTAVLWDPESNSNHPSKAWFQLFWKYLRGNCESLSIFGDFPILPLVSGHLYKPSRQLKLLNVDTLSNKMQGVLQKVGCKILDTRHGIDHPDLVNYILDADGAGVLKSIFDVVSSNDDIKEVFLQSLEASERDELRVFFVDPKWYIGNNMSDFDKRSCVRLPIFRVYDEESIENFYYSALEDQKFLPPFDCHESLLCGDFIKTSSGTEDEILGKYYGIERMGKARFYKQYVFNKVENLPPELRDIIMMSVLQELPYLSAEDPTLRGQLANLEFVPCASGLLKSPTQLYDPRNEELYALLEDSDSFPAGVFEESSSLDILHGLGLRTYVSPDAIIQSARQVERLMHSDQQRAHFRGKVLLSYLEVNALKWLPDFLNDQGTMNRMFSRAASAFRARNLKSDLEKFWNDLRLISWCPVLVSSPFQSLPWPVVSSMVAPPKLVRLYSDLWLVSASMRILDGDCSSTSLSHCLGWSLPPSGSVIAAQLLELGKNNETVTDPELRQELALAMPRIYSILMNMLNSDEMDIVKVVLEGSRWIWVGDGFATPEEVVINGSLHLAPYIRVIPVDLAVFKDLFLELGIREFLKPLDYAKILCRMSTIKGSTPLNSQELRAALLIAQHLAEVQLYEEQVKIFLPDVSCILVDATDLVYNDAPWLLGSETDASNVAINVKRSVQKYVHGNISNDVAEKLGVHSLRRMLLAESADSMNVSLSGAAEAFGQHEALTTRLKHILEMYADGPGTLFELVQNAEDAKATEVAFLLDNTHYGTSSVLSPEMADWQGPALYCFNNSVFSPQDLYAISRIGQESKLEKPFAIGRFGLGFNCVYHFTDIPTFVSGENIVLFDPHACNLPGISPSHPGLRIKFAGRKILEQFPDQFSPFLYFGCDMQQSFPGTLFRFPLRNAKVASKSQIKKEAYSPQDVTSLLSSFADVVSETLLFLRNVKTISIYTKDGVGSEMQLLHKVHKQHIGEPGAESTTFQLMVNHMHENQDGSVKNHFFDKLRRNNEVGLPWKSQKLLLTEKRLSEEKSNIWLTSECFDGRHGKRTSEAKDRKSNKFIPWACVASCLRTLEVEKNFVGKAFCFLPLPVSTGLPVHVNAYFELSSNRRDIWFGNDMAGGGKKRSEWNMYLLEEVAAPAYGHLLEKLTSETEHSDFYSFWPTSATSGPWASMMQNLYSFVADSGLRVLFTKARGGQWISTKQAIFPDFSFENANDLIDALSDAGLPMTTIPKPHVERFMEFCPSLHFLTPQLLRTLLVRRTREFRDRNGLLLALEYCLLDLKNPIDPDSLYGLPLLPLSNGSFTVFERRGLSDRVYVARGDAYNLLKDSVANQLVDSEISDTIYGKLCDMARSELFNASFLNCYLLEKLFLRLLPAEWMHAKQVTWIPGQQGQPTLEWMRVLWSYLNSDCDDLSVFSKWPILPVGNDHLLQLVENSYVIEDDGWSENMSSLLLKTGCLLLRHDLQLEHPHLNKYVQSPTASGILNALLAIACEPEKIERLFVYASEGELHELRSFILQSKWFSGGLLDESHINVIKRIPMFESFRSRKLVSLTKPSKWLKPEGILEDLLDDDFVRVESEKERKLLKRYLDIQEPSRVQFYKSYVFNRMPELVSQQSVLSNILDEIRVLIKEDSFFKKELMMTPFVLTNGGSLQEPHTLYDPRVPELQNFLHKEFFPSEKFTDPETLEMLVALGLRQTLGIEGLLDSARSVSMWHDAIDPDAVVSAKRLLGCLDALAFKLSTEEVEFSFNEFGTAGESNISLPDYYTDNLLDQMPGEEFWSELRTIRWCPVYMDPPFQGLPWLSSPQEIAAPDAVRPRSQMWLSSSMMHILDGECKSVYAQRMLGWTERLPINILSSQVVALSNSYMQLKKNSDLDSEFEVSLQEHMPVLYSNLQEYVGTDEFELLKASLNGVNWVWIGDDFVTVEALAFDSPVKYSPYLYVVPSELSVFRDLLLALGVRLNFDVSDYANVLQRLQDDVRGSPLSEDQLSFVLCVLEAVAECQLDKGKFESSSSPLLVPDFQGVLMPSRNVMYNDAPWLDNDTLMGKRIIHASISNDLANRLGIQSLRSMSLASEEMTKDLPCMDYSKICDLLELYGGKDFLLFDLIELADCCKARKLHIIFDKREHPCESLLQQSLGDFQGPALLAVLEGASLSREEISSLQFRPPWGLRGDMLNYGLGLMSCYSITDVPSVVSGGYLYMFDPRGKAFALPSSRSPAAKMFTLIGTNLTERFRDQFSPLFVGQKVPWSNDSTVIRMPISSKFIDDGTESGWTEITKLFENFIKHASRTIVFLKSVSEVSLSTWEEKEPQPSQDFLIYVDPSHATLRNPFSEKKWKKFQLSNLFGTSSSAVRVHALDINLHQKGSMVVDCWLVVLYLGSGQTRNMALDRRYLAYNLTPAAGVAVHILRNGHLADVPTTRCIMSPLPLSDCISMPVAILGCFLVRPNRGRYIFTYQDNESLSRAQPDAGNQLIEAWNRELMTCVRDSYVRLVLEMFKIRRDPSTSTVDSRAAHSIHMALNACGSQIYSFWPTSTGKLIFNDNDDAHDLAMTKTLKADWYCLVDQVIKPFYYRLVDLPVWQLYSGNPVKAEEGMFLSQPGSRIGGSVLPATVCAFVKEHYQVFSVPWELVSEIQSIGFRIREIKPKMVRDHLRLSPTSINIPSIDTYVDVLEYCLSDIQLLEPSNDDGPSTFNGDWPSPPEPSGPYRATTLTSPGQGDPIEMVASFSRALIDFGRGVVEDIGRGGGSLTERYNFPGPGFDGRARGPDRYLLKVANELKGLPCPTASSHLTKLGLTELWVGNEQQQSLMTPLAAMFIHPHILERPILARIFTYEDLIPLLKLHIFSPRLLADHMSSLFHENWVNHVMNSSPAPWFSWENTASSVREGGPSRNWVKLFWKSFSGSQHLPLFSDWPIAPAFLGRPILCRVKHCNLIFVPPILPDSDSENAVTKWGLEDDDVAFLDSSPEEVRPYMLAFKVTDKKYPWLYSLLNQCNIPIVDPAFMHCVPSPNFFPAIGQSLGQTIAAKLVTAKNSGYLPELTSFLASDCDQFFSLLASDFSSNSSDYTRQDLEVLRDLPIYKTVTGTHKKLIQETCMIASNTFLKPYNDQCLFYGSESVESQLVKALGVTELQDKQILVRFSLPEFETKTQSEQEDVLIYLYMNWEDLQQESSVIETLKDTKFIKSAEEQSGDLYKPKDLFDPGDSLLASIFNGELQKFPGERFVSDGWLNILRKAGLQNTGDPDIVLECARRVEFLGAESMKPKSSGFVDDFEDDFSNTRTEVPVGIWSLAETLISAIFANFAVLYSNNFCNTLGKIACVPAEKGFPSVSGKKGGKRALCSYSEAILLKDWPLAWSSAPILSKQSMVPPEYSWGPLQLRSPPPFSMVLKHLQGIGRNFGEDTLAHWPNESGLKSVEETSFEIFKYLDKIWGTLSSSDVSELKQVAFIPAANGTRLVTSSSLFARLTINLSPFAFELPSLYLPFVKILKELGLQDTLSISSAMIILSNLQKSCGYQRLNPNELRAVMEILHFLCDETLDSKWESELIVPDDGCRLVHANACVYIDPYGSRYVKYIDSSRLRFVHHDVSERLCLAFHIRKLSDVVVEELDREEHLQSLEQVGTVSLTSIKQKLLSRSFQVAVSNVLNTVPTTTSESKILDFPTLQKSLESIAQKLQFVQSLYTRFWLIPRSLDITRASKDSFIPEWESHRGSGHRALYYVDRLTTRMLIAEPPTYVSVLDLVSIVMSHVLGSPIVLPIGSLFFCPEGSETALVNILKLTANERSTDGIGSGNGFLGRDILPQDAMQVQLHPLRPFYKEEIVAWRFQNGEKLKYGRIPENVRPSAGQALYRFNLETFPGKFETVLSSHVFSFKSLSIGNESSSHVMSDDSDNMVASIPADQPEGSRGVKSRNQSQPIKDLEHGRVSAHELVQAVQEMLSAAGIRMDTEKQSLLQTTLSLQEQLKESHTALLLEQEKSETAAKEADTAKAAWLCRICLTNEIDITIVPCGHVLCRRCSSAVSRCPFCRLQVSNTIKIYRP